MIFMKKVKRDFFCGLLTGNLTEKSRYEDFEGSISEVNNKLETALTAKQESEAKAMTLEEKVKQYEQEIADMKEKVLYDCLKLLGPIFS